MSKQNRTRNVQLIVRVTPEEHKFILEKMSDMNTKNFNAYARKMLIDGHVFVVDLSDFRTLANEINKIGVNINQIVKLANEYRYTDKKDIEELKEMLNQIWQLLKSSLSTLQSISR